MSPDEARRIAGTLRPLAVRRYAESRQWIRLEGARWRVWLMQHPHDRLRQLQIPMDEDDVGYVDAMLDVVRRLAAVEQRSPRAVLADLQWPDADVLRVRVANDAAEGGQISLAADVMLRDGARRALLASACSVVHPASFHPRLSRSEADTLLAACRSGQTELGSYVVKIICPLYAVDEEPVPFTRRVTRHLMRVTSELVTSIERTSIDAYLDSQAESPTLSSNLCDALLRMQPRGEEDLKGDAGHLELSTTWAADSQVPPPTDAEVPSRVVIKAAYMREIERAAQRLRSTGTDVREEWLVGTVETLDGTPGADGRRSGEVYFSLRMREGDLVRARAFLDPDKYEVAMKAHMRGRADVLLLGELHRGARLWRIDPLRRLTLLDDAVGS
jgi:ketosteroid isomerase-like protein